MSRDPLEDEELSDDEAEPICDDPPDNDIQVLRKTPEWTAFGDNLANELYNN